MEETHSLRKQAVSGSGGSNFYRKSGKMCRNSFVYEFAGREMPMSLQRARKILVVLPPRFPHRTRKIPVDDWPAEYRPLDFHELLRGRALARPAYVNRGNQPFHQSKPSMAITFSNTKLVDCSWNCYLCHEFVPPLALVQGRTHHVTDAPQAI